VTFAGPSVSQYFDQDLIKLMRLLEALRFDGPLRPLAAAEELGRLLDRHFLWEEGFLFPLLAGKRPELAAELSVMRADHARLREHKEAALRAVRAENYKTAAKEARCLLEGLQAHRRREGESVFAAAEAALSEGEAAGLLETLPF
jgi:hypothetical protein